MLVDVARGSEEWDRAATLLTASVTDATLVHLQRYASCARACICARGMCLTPPHAVSKTDTCGSGIITQSTCGVMPWAKPI